MDPEMDLDDSFCKGLLQRNQARKEKIKKMKRDDCHKRALEEVPVNSDDPPEESPKRQCTEAAQSQCTTDDKENFGPEDEDISAGFVLYHSSSKNRGLAALKRNLHGDGDDDIVTTPIHQVNKSNTYLYSTNSSELCVKQKPSSRLASLAANIRQWEDDTVKPTLSSKNVTTNSTTKPLFSSTNTPNAASKANSISMKLYYSSKKPLNAGESEKHDEKYVCDSTPLSSLGKKGSMGISACEKGNIKNGSVGVKSKKLQAWDEAIMATLEPSDIPKDPVTSVSESSKEDTQKNPNLDQSSDDDEYSDAESLANDDFAENYGDFKLDDPNKMEVDDYTTKQSNVLPKLNEKNNTGKLTELKSAGVEKSFNANVDPSELPLSARKALFEKALLSGSPKVNDDIAVHTLSVTQRAAMFENASKSNTGAKNVNLKEARRIVTPDIFNMEKRNDSMKSPVKMKPPVVKTHSQESTASPVKKLPSTPAALTPSPSKNVGNHTRFIQQKLIESTGSSWQEKQTAKAVEERKQEISSLVNHWEKKISSSSSTGNGSEMQKVSLASDENFSLKSEKDEDVQESLYEESEYSELNSEEISEHEVDLRAEYSADENDYDDENSHVGIAENNHVDTAEDNHVDTAEDNSCVDTNEDNYQDDENVFYSQEEAESLKSLNEYHENKQQLDSASTSSEPNSKSIVSCISYSDILACTGDSPVYSSVSLTSDSSAVSDTSSKKEKNPEINLLRTVSAYRREKQELKITPVRKIVLNDKASSPESPPDIDYTEIIQQRLKDLQEEILRQQTVISQTSQALNLCSATTEFSGSIEQVEGERLLLIATQKRQACLNEITRMKTCGAQGMKIDGTGTLTVTDLQLPLKREFIASQVQGRDNDFVHYFLCLIRHGAQVIVTQMMSTEDKTSDGTLSFSNLIKLTNLPADFSVVFEVYALQTKKDVLPHDKKYHIKRENSKRRLTPKTKRKDNKSPAISSPGGPSAVRSPSFGIVGYTRFTIHNCNKKTFTLDKVPFTSPLEGVLRVKLQLHAEQKVYLKGCLNFYEDIGDQGALTLRWCVLDGSRIAYWRNNPEDIYKKDPVGVIDLRHCVTDVVKSVSTTECLRPHTFKLITMRPYQKGDRNTLVSRTDNTMTTKKYLLTAVSKEERILWCNKINEALTNLRKWDPEALQPIQQNLEI